MIQSRGGRQPFPHLRRQSRRRREDSKSSGLTSRSMAILWDALGVSSSEMVAHGEARNNAACRARLELLLMQTSYVKRRMERAADAADHYFATVLEHSEKNLRGGVNDGSSSSPVPDFMHIENEGVPGQRSIPLPSSAQDSISLPSSRPSGPMDEMMKPQPLARRGQHR